MSEKQKSNATTMRVVSPSGSSTQPDLNQQLLTHLRFTNLLHTSLDINEILRLFARELMQQFSARSVLYEHPALDIKMEFGEPALHRCYYRLDVDGDAFGELTCTRNKRFTKLELERLELAINCLMLPLRNALQYLRAMQNATRDALTGVGNRLALEITAEREIALTRRTGQPSAILVIDIDHFKQINDSFGHAMGDQALIETANRLKQNCRESDSIFRYGGEEFVVLLGQTEENGAVTIAERIRSAIGAINIGGGGRQNTSITASIGIAVLNRNETLHAWFDRADRALYLAKQAGRNRVVRAAQRNIA